MGTLAADLRYAVRTLARNPGFAAIALLTLALGTGANIAIFSVVNAVLLQPLPYAEPERIVELCRKYPGGYGNSNSIPKFMAWRENHVFSAMTLYDDGLGMSLGTGEAGEPVHGAHVSSGYFDVFGVAPAVGRTFQESEDLPGGPKLAVISHSLWQSRLGGDRQILGRTIALNNDPYTVIGVLPKAFHPDPEVDLWIPLQADPHSGNQGHYLAAAARLKPGVTLSEARAEMKAAGERFRARYPKCMDKNETVGVRPMQEAAVSNFRTALLVLLGAVGLVLLIACANVANLLLARAAARQKEMAVRAAIGASRGRVLRQLLTESVLLASVGAACGLALGTWGVRALMSFAPGNIPRLTAADGAHAVAPPLDWRVTAFTLGVALVTGVLFGLFPALHVSNPDLAASLKEAGGRSGTGRRHNLARSALVVSEVALALVLLVGAVLLIRSFMGLNAASPGIDAHHVLTAETSIAGGRYAGTAKVDAFVRNVVRRLETTPGVESAAASLVLPVAGEVCDLPFQIVGKPPGKGSEYNGDEQWRSVSEHYFHVFRVPLLRGRVFRETDVGNSQPVVVINETMARHYWGKEDPIGQLIVIGKGLGPQFDDPPRLIVGVVGNVRETGLAHADAPTMYLPESQVPEGFTALINDVLPLSWSVRTAGDPLPMSRVVEKQFRSVDPTITLARQRTMERVLAQSLTRQNFNTLLLSIFAAVALLLAAVGIYGLMSYAVEQRKQEIGIRIALGAGRADVLRLMLAQGMKLAGAGVVLGLGLAWAATRFLVSLLFGVKATDLATFAGVALSLSAVALLATWVPALRAARTEPDRALRA